MRNLAGCWLDRIFTTSCLVKLYKYIRGIQMGPLVLNRKGLVLGGWPSKIEVIWALGIYIYYIYLGCTSPWIYIFGIHKPSPCGNEKNSMKKWKNISSTEVPIIGPPKLKPQTKQPKRSWKKQPDFLPHRFIVSFSPMIVETNIPGSSFCVQKFVPKFTQKTYQKEEILHTWKIQVHTNFCLQNKNKGIISSLLMTARP